jgi:hypothetical protein
MTARGLFFWKAAAVAAFAFVAAAVFTAYLQPSMLIEFANLLLCM